MALPVGVSVAVAAPADPGAGVRARGGAPHLAQRRREHGRDEHERAWGARAGVTPVSVARAEDVNELGHQGW